MDCLFLPPSCGADLSAGEQLYWLPEKAAAGRHLKLGDCAEVVLGRPQALVLPAECCSSFIVSLPTEKARWLRKALPYALEELMAEDVEQMHLALGERMADGRHRVLAVKRDVLNGWLEQLTEQGVRVKAIYMDADLLPRKNGQLLVANGRVLIGGAGEARMVCMIENWLVLAGGWSETLHGSGDTTETPLGCIDYQVLESPYRLLAEGQDRAVNLAQGEFSLRSPLAIGWAKPILGIVGFWVMLQLFFDAVQGWQLTAQGNAYAAANRALYQELFPDDRRIVNLRAQFDEHLRGGEETSGASGFLGMLDYIVSAITEVPAVKIQQLEYQGNAGELSIQVDADDFSSLEKLRDYLTKAGVDVRIGSAARQESGITARIVIMRVGGGDASSI